MRPLPRFRAFAGHLLYCVYLLAFLLIVAFALHARWVGPLRAKKPGASLEDFARRGKIPVELFASLGLWHCDARRDSFFAAARPKPPDLLRIGVFGDSMSMGDEVDAGLDFPSILGELLRRDGVRAEVLNIANSWWGFHQSAYAWDRFGRDLELDYVLLGPATFWHERDSTFNHAGMYQPYYIHGRYVLDGDGVRWIDPAGAPTNEDRFANYFGFFPAWNYLRYDQQAPTALRALLPEGRELRNPFFYARGMADREEVAETYRRLLRRMANSGSKVVLLHYNYNPSIVSLGHQADPRIKAGGLEQQLRFPYWRITHHSGAGNQLVAAAFRDAISEAPPRARALDFTDLDVPRPKGAKPAARLVDFHRMRVLLDGQEAASLIRAHDYHAWVDEPVDFASDKSETIIALRAPGKTLLDSVLLLSPLRAAPNAHLRLVVQGRGVDASQDFGPATRVANELPMLVWTLPSLIMTSPRPFEADRVQASGDFVNLITGQAARGATARLMLGEEPLYEIRMTSQGRSEFVPLAGTEAYLRPQRNTRVDLDRIGATGHAILSLDGKHPLRIPVASWKSVPYRIAPGGAE